MIIQIIGLSVHSPSLQPRRKDSLSCAKLCISSSVRSLDLKKSNQSERKWRLGMKRCKDCREKELRRPPSPPSADTTTRRLVLRCVILIYWLDHNNTKGSFI
ncbi:hypothetical protein E3U43_021624 [Larimichthys crocea]|uniref:Uncharacterized protein n=1 Tax=Larimichthys crocea TaxID=215358 RepID=A0ACD3R771_LARCR|nr:hypothetical protein E3U43_021624 [Larimichthys crocea]